MLKYETRKSPPDSKLIPYSYSILDAVTVCPMWGVIRYGHRKHYESNARAMALEFGSAAHEVFAAIYLWQLGFIQHLPDHMDYHGRRIFGDSGRFSSALITKDKEPDQRDSLISLGYNILHSGDFFNDPLDKVRTIENLEIGIIKYVDNVLHKMDKYPIWVSDDKDAEAPVGIEIAFDIELVRDESLQTPQDLTKIVRYIGQIDRLHSTPDENELILGENKTGARLDQSWAGGFDMSHQLTGYCLAVYTVLQKQCTRIKLHGLKSKQTGASEDFNPIDPKDRDEEMFRTFIDWAIYSQDIYETYMKDWENSPRFTHSCNRYFKSCSLLTFCTDTKEGRKQQFGEMIDESYSPSERAVMDKVGMLDL